MGRAAGRGGFACSSAAALATKNAGFRELAHKSAHGSTSGNRDAICAQHAAAAVARRSPSRFCPDIYDRPARLPARHPAPRFPARRRRRHRRRRGP
ncbi:hypothetical protein [Lysobacter gummosus]|uniref:hypothetical protein n=1 Tax=Lysobacter gummosus TaxID=262324 RepID=UPI0036369482